MIRLIQGKVLGMEMTIVLWETDGEFHAKGFNSIEYARNYVMRTFPHINGWAMDVERAHSDLSRMAWALQTY